MCTWLVQKKMCRLKRAPAWEPNDSQAPACRSADNCLVSREAEPPRQCVSRREPRNEHAEARRLARSVLFSRSSMFLTNACPVMACLLVSFGSWNTSHSVAANDLKEDPAEVAAEGSDHCFHRSTRGRSLVAAATLPNSRCQRCRTCWRATNPGQPDGCGDSAED
jgi:hypothetical protein